MIEEFIIYINENKYGEIDIKNKSISISYTDGTGDSENNDISDIINQISSLINQPGPRIRIIPNILFSNLIINDPTNIINRSFEEKNDIVKPMCKEFKEGLKKIKINEEDDISCAICQDKFKEGENVIELPCKEGSHFFHFEERGLSWYLSLDGSK